MRKLLLDDLPERRREETPDKRRIEETFEFELITPMVGGDSESWQLNEDAPVRTQSVKGHLRFWWRTMQSEKDPVKLLTKENKIWGGKVKDNKGKDVFYKSKISISVLKQRDKGGGKPLLVKHVEENSDIPKYLAFPFNNKAIKYAKPGLQFTLFISYPKDFEDTVMNTLKLWTFFGGVGARTRKGCGSLYCEEILKEFDEIDMIQRFMDKLHCDGAEKAYPTLGKGKIWYRQFYAAPVEGWGSLIEQYACFRQDRRAPIIGKKTPGRSYWPEPDAIRKLADTYSARHEKILSKDLWFPRASLGLPIKFRFKLDGKGHPNEGPKNRDPRERMLLPAYEYYDRTTKRKKTKYLGRLSSPIVLKIVRLPGKKEKLFQVGLLLHSKLPEKLILKTTDSRVRQKPDDLEGKYMPQSNGVLRRYKNRMKPVRVISEFYEAVFIYLFGEGHE